MTRRGSIDLSQFDEDFRNEQADARDDFESVPDGKYQVNVEKVELVETQSTGNPRSDCRVHPAVLQPVIPEGSIPQE
jgi:hypothetical protein